MARTLAAFAASDAPLTERLRVARELAEAVASLHATGRIHGALSPERVLVPGEGAAVVLPPPADADPPLRRAGFDAPEVARGARPTRRSDAFSAGALAWLALAGRAPFEAEEALARVQRVLFGEPGSLRLAAPALSPEVEAAIAAALEKRARRRGTVERLVRALGAVATGMPTAAGDATSRSTPTGTPNPEAVRPERSADAEASARSRRAPTPTPTRTLSRLPRLAFLRGLSPLHRASLVALPLLLLALPFLGSDAALEREIASLLEAGDLQGARRRVEAAAKERPDDPLVEKLRGDVACARGAAGECIRRYRIALASRPELREDRALRANARRLVQRDEACSTRRAAAHLLGELRDPEALPALEEARRSGGIFAAFCTGDSIDRAITATRATTAR